MTRGEGGWLLLPSAGLSPAILRQFAWRTPARADPAVGASDNHFSAAYTARPPAPRVAPPCDPSPDASSDYGRRPSCVPARRHIPVNTPRFELRKSRSFSTPRRPARFRLRREPTGRVEQLRQTAWSLAFAVHPSPPATRVLSVLRRLPVRALLEPWSPVFMILAFRVREVALRLLGQGSPYARLVRSVPPSGLRSRPACRSAGVVRRPLRHLQTRLRRPDRRQTIFPPTQLRRRNSSPRTSGPNRTSSATSVSSAVPQQLVDLPDRRRSSSCIRPMSPCACSRSRVTFVRRRQLPNRCKAQLASQTDHLDEQLLETQVPPPKLADRPVLREVARRQHAERHVSDFRFRAIPRDSQGRLGGRVGVERHLHQHPRRIPARCDARRPRTSRERRQIASPSTRSLMPLPGDPPQPLPYIRRQQQRLLRCVAGEMSSTSSPYVVRLFYNCRTPVRLPAQTPSLDYS